jgi:Trp operon repressor
MIPKKTIDELAQEAYQGVLATNNNKTLDQLITKSEKIQIGRRVMIAQAIMLGKTRMEINEKMKVSPNTFAQIRQWIESEFADYTPAHQPKDKAKNKSTATKRRHNTPGAPFSYQVMSQRYPGHFLLISEIKKLFS